MYCLFDSLVVFMVILTFWFWTLLSCSRWQLFSLPSVCYLITWLMTPVCSLTPIIVLNILFSWHCASGSLIYFHSPSPYITEPFSVIYGTLDQTVGEAWKHSDKEPFCSWLWISTKLDNSKVVGSNFRWATTVVSLRKARNQTFFNEGVCGLNVKNANCVSFSG